MACRRLVLSTLWVTLILLCPPCLARGTAITEVPGVLECPDLHNGQECAWRFEAALLKAHREVVWKTGEDSPLHVRLLNGKQIDLSNPEEGDYDAVDLQVNGRFLILRDQWFEGNTWLILDRKNEKLTNIGGYPLFSPDQSRFVAIETDLDATYSDTVLDVYRVEGTRIVREYRAFANQDEVTWGAFRVTWSGNQTVRFTKRTWVERDWNWEDRPARLVLGGGTWRIVEGPQPK